MKLRLFSLVLISSLTCLSQTESDDKWIVRISAGEPIEDLVLNPAPEIEKEPKTGKPIYVIKGIYFRESWDLVFEGNRVVTDGTGVFYLRFPITGETTTVELVAKGPGKKIQTEKIGIVVPKEQQEVVLKDVEVKSQEKQDFKIGKTELKDLKLGVKKKEDALEISEDQFVGDTKEIKSETVVAPTEGGSEETSPWRLKSLFAGPLVALQNSATQKNYTFTLGWSPAYIFSPKWKMRLLLGAMAFEKVGGGRFFATDTTLFGEWLFFKRVSLAFGPGFQYWWSFGGFNAEAAGELSYYWDATLFKTVRIERIFGSFSWLFDNLRTKQVRIGAALTF